MTIPLLQYAPSTQNGRVEGYDPRGDEQSFIFTTENILSDIDLDVLIDAAYRQIFFHAFKADREQFLESQLRNGQITVRDFIRGLLLSETYLDSFYTKNNNYRFVEQCVQRVLGRDVYGEREKLAWSIVIAKKGVATFVDELLNTDEYLENFGYDTVPYQRRRSLASRAEGDTPFNVKSPRYDAYHRAQLGFPKLVWQNAVRRFRAPEQAAKAGDPSLPMYVNMARKAIIPQVNAPVSTANINMSSVPYRKV
ncbi:Phycobilisome linker polypeptide [[Leptolyngbya] sp. PCC 7376]|uniref:phycobilisome rod-core linker polypeptide n=1 Tax=[Leptolyngbya] sp. PCC 7376 TaxID=111781 RepID=UPI00029EFFE9|nr:phycobilisome rod-core linker polypeptide [[Leptolyngbya] sp. PCC 7376]AFY39188.1 Phycobilisome linker polypeptide [[Leptolyngbya] sp. PCC 7376]